MSDLISREGILEYLKTVTVTEGITFETGFKQILHDIETQSSVDIMECARALKEHCNEHLRKPHTLCDDCPMFERVCRRFNVVPRWWDLPEGEKE